MTDGGVRVEHVSKVFEGGVKAVDDVSLEIADGEFMVLVGPSGCGKTTLLRMIAGLEQVRALVASHPATAGKEEIQLPYVTDVYSCRRLDERPVA